MAVMERTRDEVLRLLYERGECSVADLATAIGVSDSAVRRHLDLLEADGLVVSRLERIPRGRPITRYALSEAGEEARAAAHYQRLLARLSPALVNLTPEEVRGQTGREILDRVFDHVAASVADEHRGKVTSPRLEERVQQVLGALTEEGILREVEEDGDFYRLKNAGCPYRSTAMETAACCSADRRTIELLLGAPVEQVMTLADGGHQCEYLVPKQGDPASRGDDETTAGTAGGLLPVMASQVAQKGTTTQR
ncbi:MAG: helix-turn-helix transcriptional regulator [Dehalococcoidia bacterium]